MYIPPLTSIVAPVTNDERSEARKRKTLAISVGVAIRPNGILARILSITSWLILSPRMSVATMPGVTALTRMFLGPELLCHIFGQTEHACFRGRVVRSTKDTAAGLTGN
jgi:hypothetical protein